jgi:hypothetical protein
VGALGKLPIDVYTFHCKHTLCNSQAHLQLLHICEANARDPMCQSSCMLRSIADTWASRR